jgi:hypothetical protein
MMPTETNSLTDSRPPEEIAEAWRRHHEWLLTHCFACGRELAPRIAELMRKADTAGVELADEEVDELNADTSHQGCFD